MLNCEHLQNMQAHRRKKKKRPIWTYMRNIRSLFLEADEDGGRRVFGFTLSGQQPCILSSIVKNSPADLAGVKSGDFLISVNGKSVWQKNHEEIVELIASSEYRIHITVADNCFSDSSDDEQESSQNFRPKYPYAKSRSSRFHPHESNFEGMPPSRFHTHPPLPHLQSRNVMLSPGSRNYDISNVSAMLKGPSSSKAVASSSSTIMNGAETVSFSILVGYLGTIEMPKQIATSSKLQTVRSCIRKLRQEKRCPTLVLMNILPSSLNLLNSNNVILATYPSNRLNYISSSSDTNSKFFGLVTSATFQEEDSHSFESRQSIAISNSCHVFGVETKLIDHNAHLQTAEKFHLKCTKDLISNSCLEFPMTSDYICNIIKSMYNIKSPEKVENDNPAMQFQNHRRNQRFHDPHELLLPNSPHPSEITTSSNSDSGIGFHNDLNNISDRCFVVDIPDKNQNRSALIHNKNLHLQRQRRPLGIVNDYQLQDAHAVRNIKLPDSPQPSTSGIFHAKSKSADYDYTAMEKLAIRAMPIRNLPPTPVLNNSFEGDHRPKAVEDVWYDGEMLDEDGNEIHERPVDVPNTFVLDPESNDFHKMMIQSCDDILMIMNKEDVEAKKDGHVFLVPAKPKRCSKKSLTLLGKSKSSNDDAKSKHESNLKHYKLSPKVFGLPRPVSMSFENLSSSSTKRRSLFGSKKKESKTEEEPFGIWGSLQELRNSDSLKTQPCNTFLEGTFSEPNLSVDEAKHSQSDISPFKRWGQSSLRGARSNQDSNHRRPSSLTASESDVYTKIIEHDKNEKKHSSSHSIAGAASWGQSFELLLNDQNGLKIFGEFLKKEFSGENIYFWTACERYRQINDDLERRKEAMAIYEKHLGNGAHEPVNVDCNARNFSRDGLARAEKDLFSSAQKQIFNLMKFDSYQRFIRGELYKSCVHAEQTNQPMPYSNEPLDPMLRTKIDHQISQTVKLKKSASNAEDRRRKSLLPWHRKTRCKSKDREEENKDSNTLKRNATGDVHSSRSSLSSFDATISKMSSIDSDMRNSLCRVILRENGATTIVQIKSSETIRELVERVLEKRGFSYQAYEVFLSGTNKPLDLDEKSSGLSGNEVFIEQRVIFKLDLPNRKVISVKSKPSKLVCEVLRPILHKYSYRLDMVEAFSKESSDPIDTALQVTSVDGMRLQIVCKEEIDDLNDATANAAASQKNFIAPVTYVRANKLVSSISNPQLNTLALDEITNKVFNEVLQGKGEAGTANGVVNGTNRNSGGDHGSVKSEDWGSETETSSGIFNRIRRHNKKSQKSKSSAGSEESGDVNAVKKPLIAKWKVGSQKLQVASSNINNLNSRSQNDDSLLETLKRAQFSRIEDQRGTDINFELPEFLKDRNKFSNAASKLRKTNFDDMSISSDSMSIYSNIESLSPNKNEFGKVNAPQQKPPQPLPRTSLGKSPLKSEMNSVQSKINNLEQLMNSSRSNTPINLNLSTQCLPSTTPNMKNRNSDGYFCNSESFNGVYGDTPMSLNDLQRSPPRDSTLPPTLPPKPKLIPAKPNNWQMTNNKDVYLDQPTSSFV